MLEIMYHLKNRYMSQRAQGIVEYAIVIAFIIVIGYALLSGGDNDIAQAVQNIFSKLWSLLNTAETKTTNP